MLIFPPDHQKQTQPGRALTRRERRLLGGVGGVATALLVAVVVALTTTGARSGHGCIHAVYAGPVGAEQLNSCGTQAREICAQVGQRSSFGPDARRTIATECRRAGLPVG